MTFRLAMRTNESADQEMWQRILGYDSTGVTAPTGVGTGYASGIVGKIGHFVVTQSGTAVFASAGWAVVIRDDGTTTFDPRALLCEEDSNTHLTAAIPANAQGTSRTDTICLRVVPTDSVGPASDATGSNQGSLVIIQGGASNALGNAPVDGALYFPLANGVIANGATSYSTITSAINNTIPGVPSMPYKARMYAAAAQSIPNAPAPPYILINTDTKVFDPNNNFNTVTHQYTCPVSGYYLVVGSIGWNAGPSQAAAILVKNGSGASAILTIGAQNSATGSFITAVSDISLYNAGDTIDLRAYHNAGAASNTNGGGNTYFSVHFLSRS